MFTLKNLACKGLMLYDDLMAPVSTVGQPMALIHVMSVDVSHILHIGKYYAYEKLSYFVMEPQWIQVDLPLIK